MSESAVDRTPIELWSLIIHLCTIWDPLPSSDSPISAHLSFFQPSCARYHSFRQIAALRGKLRLVSKSWDAIINKIPHDLVIIGINKEIWPAARALERATCIEHAVSREYCKCRASSNRVTQRSVMGLPIPYAFRYNTLIDRLMGNTNRAKQVKIYISGYDMVSIDEAVDFVPPLKALLTRVAEGGSTIHWLTSPTLRHLTHLDLYEIDPFAVPITDKIILPSIVHLRLELLISIVEERSTAHTNSQDPPQLLSQLLLPSLQVLIIEGFTRRSIEDIVDAFITKHNSTLELLVSSFMWVQNEVTLKSWSAPSSLWDKMPNLRAFSGLSVVVY